MTLISQSERDIRNATVARARELWPTARIIHELNVEHGKVRADLAAVTPDCLVLLEIKSERDKLHRLSMQLRLFGPVCHHLIVVAHERWCSGSRYPNCDVKPIITFAGHGELWAYPETVHHITGRSWRAPFRANVPWSHRMLRLLWTDELQRVGAAAGIDRAHRMPGYRLADQLARVMPGADIERAVCAALRAREFAEADAPIEVRHAA